MDKYEYQVCADQINAFIAEKRFAEAMEIADRIDWRRVKSVSMLCTVSEVYKVNKKYEESRDILLLAYERYPEGRTIVYALCELAIKMNDVVNAVEYYKQYMRIAPEDTNSYVLLYKIYEAQDVTLEERIQVLEEFKKRDYREKWAYELAYLYHKIGQESKCVAECDELVLWFGDGKYVRKALQLKKEHADLTPEQQRKLEGKTDPQIVQAYGQPIQDAYYQGMGYDGGQQGYYPQQDPYMNQYTQPYQQPYYGDSIQVQPVNTGKFSTMNLQEELARSMEAFMASEGADIQGNYYGSTSQLYEPAQDPNSYANPYGAQYENSFEQQNNISQQMYGDIPQPQNGSSRTEDLMRAYEQQEGIADSPAEAYSVDVPQVDLPQQEEHDPQSGKKFESVLKQEYDGQISLSLPDSDMVERQITGQMNLEDILKGHEDNTSNEVLDNPNVTSDIMSKLEGVIPGTVAVKKIEPSQTQPQADEPKRSSGRMLTLEEEYGGHLAEVRRAVEEEAREEEERARIESAPMLVPEPEVEAEIEEEIEEELEEIIAEPEEVEPEPEPEPIPEPVPEPMPEPVPEPVPEQMPEPEPVIEQEPTPEPQAFEYEDYGEVEEIEDIEQPDDIDDMIKTSNLPITDIDRIAQANYEAGIEPEPEPVKRRSHPSYMKLEEAVKSRREFTPEESAIFARYEGIESLKAQIVEVMDSFSMVAARGNVVVMGPENTGRKDLALDVVKAIQSKNQNFSGKVAKISGDALNKKNIPLTIKKLRNGALIVENAGGLTKESINIITDALMQENEAVLVVLEGTTETVEPVLAAAYATRTVFDSRIEISAYSNDDLVAYGKGYAKEQEYSIDEMGILALYTRIGDLQSLDHEVSIEEVEEIVDTAIKHVDRKNMAHFMDVLLAKRYDDDDYIVLREKDFIVK